jgi:hypothetical protein
MSPTACWLWDVTSMTGKEIKQCHSLPVVNGDMNDETSAWQGNTAMSLTAC